MSANIPFEIQEEIIKYILPVKSLIRFRSVSKQWKSLIDSSEFITHHSVNQKHPHHVVVSYRLDSESKYVLIVDDDSFPHHKTSPSVTPTILKGLEIIGSSHGLVCLHGGPEVIRNNLIVVWNPSIRKYVCIDIELWFPTCVTGFGVCPKTGDPKIIKTTCETSIAEVFRLNSWSWISVPMNLPNKSIKFVDNQVILDGVIYWIAFDDLVTNNHVYHNWIISFDLTNEEFGKVDLPDYLVRGDLSIYKIKESIVVVDYNKFDMCDVWMMIKNSDPKSSFVKLYSVRCRDGCISKEIIGFRRNGQPIIENESCYDDSLVLTLNRTLEVYEPYTQHSNDLGFDAIYNYNFLTTSYIESLLLLNHFDPIIHDDDDRQQ